MSRPTPERARSRFATVVRATGGTPDRSTRSIGVMLAATTACISGVAVFVNGYAVRRFPDPTTYTTAKNLLAAAILVLVWRAASARSRDERPADSRPRGRAGLVAIGIVGGSVPFVLFFEGLAKASSTDAAFIHKTLVVWVALLAVPLLGERLTWPHGLAISLLVGGHAVLAGDLGALRAGGGETMILVATLLWSAEVVIAKRVLRTRPAMLGGTARMAIGSAVLVGWALVRGELGALVSLGTSAWAWALLTGVILASFVATWYSALARAQAVDVTAVLVFGAVITAVLDTAVRGAALADPRGLGLIVLGAGVAAVAARARREAVVS